ncbi:MAG: hypothetical protein LC687_02930 [Actinobacteria bacterium]|nr:hypothetical protein [Actinomycetota bacterium]
MTQKEAVKNKEKAIINLWLAFQDLSDYGDDAITDEDLVLWDLVAEHSDMQSTLNEID